MNSFYILSQKVNLIGIRRKLLKFIIVMSKISYYKWSEKSPLVKKSPPGITFPTFESNKVMIKIAVVALIMMTALIARTSEAGPRVIKNPYSDINWNQVKTYVANFHSHTVLSDGRAEPDELIYMHADAGYDILAITDHDNYYTHREGERDILQYYIHRDDNTRVPTSETTWPWTRWIQEHPSKIWVYQGRETSAFYPDLGERGMLAIRAAELTTHPHIVSLFTDCGWPDRGNQTGEERMECVEQSGGLAYWVHPTHYVPGGMWENRSIFDDGWEEAITYYGDHIIKFNSNPGFEMQLERSLELDIEMLDRMLMKYYPEHDIFVQGSDDTHATSVPDNTTLTLVLAEDLTENAVRHALENGHKFVGSRTDIYPQFNEIIVDEMTSTITVDIDNYDRIRWIKNGKEYVTGTTLDYSGMANAVVRFEVDQGGVTFYSQGFYIQ